MGDFNVEANDSTISVSSGTDDLKSLIKEPACYKNPINLRALALF